MGLGAYALYWASELWIKIEIQSLFNELRNERLSELTDIIGWKGAIILAGIVCLTIVFKFLNSFLNFIRTWRKPSNNVESTKEHEADARKSAEEAKQLVEEIKKYTDEIKVAFPKINAENFANNPTEARRAVEDVHKNPRSSLLGKALTKALYFQEQGRKEEATETWRGIANVAKEINKDIAAWAWVSIASLLGQQGKHREAIAACDKALSLKPNLAAAYNNRGTEKGKLGQYKAAILDFDKALNLKPDLFVAYSNRGAARDRLDQHEAAITDYDEALRLNPNYFGAFFNRGVAKAALGRHEAAIADYDEALRLKPEDAEAYINRGAAKFNLGQHNAAIADYSEALRLKPDYAEAYYNLGEAKAILGQKDEAREGFTTALNLARAIGNPALATLAKQDLQKLDEQQGA